MPEKIKYVITKDEKTNEITYIEYDSIKGFNVKPKNTYSIENMINVNEMTIINPSLIEKLIDKKATRTIEKILNMLKLIDNEDTDDETGCELILGELERFKSLVQSKYIEYMKKEKYKLLMKKIEIIEKEIERKKEIILFNQTAETKKTKPRR